MKIAITGSSKLAGAIADKFDAECIRLEQNVDHSKYDIFINCAHQDFEQTKLLMKWFESWRNDSSKIIVNISSRAAEPNISKGHMYAAQKASMEHLANNLMFNSDKQCRIVTLSLGLLEHEYDLPSVKYTEVCDVLEYIFGLPEHLEISRIMLQNSANYRSLQEEKQKYME